MTDNQTTDPRLWGNLEAAFAMALGLPADAIDHANAAD